MGDERREEGVVAVGVCSFVVILVCYLDIRRGRWITLYNQAVRVGMGRRWEKERKDEYELHN